MGQMETIKESLKDLQEGRIDQSEYQRRVKATEIIDPLKGHREMAKRLEESGAEPGGGKDRACVE